MPTTTTTPAHDPTPAFARQILELYAESLSDVRFPDLDLAQLEKARAALLARQLEVERGEAALAAARAELESQSDALHTLAERALAYARVYAQGQASSAALTARLAEVGARKKPLALVEGGPAPIKRRGRSKKPADASELFVAEDAPQADAPDDAEQAEPAPPQASRARR